MMKILRLLIFAIGFGAFASAPAAAQQRIESEYKLDVPPEAVDSLWAFMVDTFAARELLHYDSSLTYSFSEEVFEDRYFDTPKRELANLQIGLRYRRRYVADTLVKELVQLKLPAGDSSGVARREIKFNVYRKVKKGSADRMALHPFWRLIRPSERPELSRLLIYYKIEANELRSELSLRQLRRRVYISRGAEPLITLTLDQVEHRGLPHIGYAELEMELNELRYTRASAEERLLMERLNEQFKQEILSRFPQMQQDQRPKYNKLLDLLEQDPRRELLHYWPYALLLALMLAAATGLLLRRNG